MSKSHSRLITGLLALVMAFTLLLVMGGPAGAADDVWYAEFWNNKDLSGSPVSVRYDKTIDFDWGHGSPGGGVASDNFSARWTRRVYFPNSGTYRFNATMDDAMRVWLDGNLIIDSWTDSQEHTMTRDVYVTAGDHDLRVDYYEAGGVAIAKFWWDFLGGSGGSGGSGGGYGGGGYYPNWKGEYYNNTTLSGAPVLVRDDRYLQFDWGFGSPAPGVVNEDYFSVRWTRTLTANPGQYRIWITSDDGARLWINNQLLIDNWGVQAASTKSADYFHPGGSVQIRVEYFENLERASISTGVALITGYQESLTNKPGVGGS